MNKELRFALVDIYTMVIFMRYNSFCVKYQVSKKSRDILSKNKIKLGGRLLYQNGEPVYYIFRKYRKSRVTGRYNEVLPLLKPFFGGSPNIDLNDWRE